MLFQVFKLAALVVRGPKEEIPPFTLGMNSVTLPSAEVLSAVTCVQHFVREPMFTQRSFFTENGVAMLNSAIASASSVCTQVSYNPWSSLKHHSNRSVASELSASYEVVIGRRENGEATWSGCSLLPKLRLTSRVKLDPRWAL